MADNRSINNVIERQEVREREYSRRISNFNNDQRIRARKVSRLELLQGLSQYTQLLIGKVRRTYTLIHLEGRSRRTNWTQIRELERNFRDLITDIEVSLANNQ